ncbi:MAG: S41 family peptidase [Alphaproteobacteria bacterium]
MRQVDRGAHLAVAAALALSLFTASCGGGGGGGGGASSGGGSTTPTGPTWTQGAYAPSSQFINRCQTVRTGVDIEGNPFPDMAGSTLQEEFFLRSWTHETYLWNTEVTDRNPASYNDRLAYFDLLKTTATTASGKPKDQFHFSEATSDYLADVTSAPQAGYGANYAALATTPPRDFRIAYDEPNSPASAVTAGQIALPRGSKILTIDGVDLVNANTQAAVNSLNAGLFPASVGESHTFVVQDAGASTTRTVTLVSANVAQKPVSTTAIIPTSSGSVGYVMVATFNPDAAEQDIASAITAMKNGGVSDLVLDLRYNGGGLLAVASELAYMIAGDARTSGKNFERLQFNAAAGNLDPVTGQTNSPVPFYTTALGFSLTSGTALNTLSLPRVFVLSTSETCSASEAVINSLRGIGVNVVLVGSGTCGKPYGFYPQDNCGETYFSIQFQGVNDAGFGDYADGFIPNNSSASFGVRVPGCAVADDFNHDLGDPNEGLLAAALQYRDTATCPVVSAASVAVAQANATASGAIRGSRLSAIGEMIHNSRDMRLPGGRRL